jgi:hypothetical protein
MNVRLETMPTSVLYVAEKAFPTRFTALNALDSKRIVMVARKLSTWAVVERICSIKRRASGINNGRETSLVAHFFKFLQNSHILLDRQNNFELDTPKERLYHSTLYSSKSNIRSTKYFSSCLVDSYTDGTHHKHV